MHQRDERHYIEASHFSAHARRMWERVGPADEMLTLELADYVQLKGELPESAEPRSSLFRTPTRTVENRSATTDTALEIQIPACDLGALALRHWRDFTTADDARIIGGEILRALAHTDRGFWEIPTILRGNVMFPGETPAAEGFLAVTTAPGRSFEEAKLSFLFHYHGSKAFFAHAQIDSWISEVSSYLVRRGLVDSFITMVGEGRPLPELLREGRKEIPVPRNAVHAESFEELIPESLLQRGTFHGRHPQVQFERFRLQVRVPIHSDVPPDFTVSLNQSAIVQELMRRGFSVSWCDGLIGGLSSSRGAGTQSLADCLPDIIDLSSASFHAPPPDPKTHTGPYLHIVADNLETKDNYFDAASGTLLLLYRFKDYITGLERVS